MNTNTFTDPRDGKTYRTIQIGSQRWLAENLKYLPSVCPSTATQDCSVMYYVYDYQGCDVNEAITTSHYHSYGVLYNWAAALTSAPPGWHLPSDAEWNELTDFLIRAYSHINAANVGYALKSLRQATDFPDWNTIEHGTDEFGFSALPGGRCSYGGFYRLGELGYWWSSTVASSLRAWCRQIGLSGTVNRWDMSKNYGYTVRCIQDYPNE